MLQRIASDVEPADAEQVCDVHVELGAERVGAVAPQVVVVVAGRIEAQPRIDQQAEQFVVAQRIYRLVAIDGIEAGREGPICVVADRQDSAAAWL